MFDMKTDTLRGYLRTESSAAHDALDARVGRESVATEEGLARFLGMNAAAFTAMDAAGAVGEYATAAMIGELALAARQDLHTLGLHPGRLPCPAASFHPMAVDYVVLGSRIGTGLLRRNWQGSAVPSVTRAARYFSIPADHSAWRALCAQMSQRGSDDPEAAEILSGVLALFALFSAAHDIALQETPHA